MFATIRTAIILLMRKRSEPYKRCSECGAQGKLVWFCTVRCSCGAAWKWKQVDGGKWVRDVLTHGGYTICGRGN